jgi:hypothetical protein
MASGRGPAVRYEVRVPGEFGPAYCAAFCAMGAERTHVSSVFFLRAPEGTGIPDIAAMLDARGLEILEIRAVPSRDPRHRPSGG